ncbi:MAG TPA: ribbon-helix-helix protein, CopG family [Candidatus Nanoarchaeia archaeon]|nr:putative nickel-responsive regulator [uncultured archaeon]
MATVTISLPKRTAEKIDQEAKKHGFSTRSEFVRNVLRTYLAEDSFQEFTPQPISKIKLELARTGKYSEKFIDSLTRGLEKSSVYGR